jgi:hypothetical protein
VEFDAVEARIASAACGIGEQSRQLGRQMTHIVQMHVGHPLSSTEFE